MTTRHALIVAFAVTLLALIAVLIRRSRITSSPIHLDDLLLGDDGKVSKAAFVMLGSFFVTSWTILYLVINDKLSEWVFTAYVAAWVAPTVTRLIVNQPLPATQTTAITQTTVVPTKGKK